MLKTAFFKNNGIEDHTSMIFDALIGYCYLVKDRDLRFVSCNERLAKAFGAPNKAGVIGKTDDSFIPPHLLKSIREDDINILETGCPVMNKVELVPTGDGFVDWATTTKLPLRDPDGVICGIIGAVRPFGQSTASIAQSEELGPALELIHRSYYENLSVPALASTLNLSLSSFQRKFKACFGMSPKEYIRNLRVRDSCHRIRSSNESLAEIAYSCGFSDQSHFSRVFTRIMKESPSAFRSHSNK